MPPRMRRAALLTLTTLLLALDRMATGIFLINWDSDIIASAQESEYAERDALSIHFGADKKNLTIFPSYEVMKERIGPFKDVDRSKLVNHNYVEMTAWLKATVLNYPNITYLYSVGKSVQGRELWVLVVSDNPRQHELLEPEVKIVANMHGNEVVGREAVLYLIEVLCSNYGKNEYLTKFVDNQRIHFMASMNPDGYEHGLPGDRVGYYGRSNEHNVDLNRNFPARFPSHREQSGGGDPEPETAAVMKWLEQYPFVISANLHGGSLVANYPFDDSVTGQDHVYSATPDDKLFVELAYRYARAHPRMWKTGRRCGLSVDGDVFLNGITNGADWYHLAGGMQDWQYTHTNSFEVTIEMGCYKFPTNDMLPKFWEENQFSLISLLEMAHKGVYGLVTDINGKPAGNATIAVEQGKTIRSTSAGEYWRILPPGKHLLTAEAPGLEMEKFEVEVKDVLIRHDFKLKTCHDQDITQSIIMRGTGRVRIAVVGIGSGMDEVVRKLAHQVCSGEFELDPDIRLIMAPVLSAGDVMENISSFSPVVVLAITEGFVETITFSPARNQPRLFNKTAVDESLTKALGFGSNCEKPIRDARLALTMDDLRLHSAFELGIALGCDNSTDSNNLEKKAATVGTVIDMLKKAVTLDSVQEYSVVPSANPSDHFTPNQAVMVTSASIPLLKEKQCLFTVPTKNRLLNLYRMGSGEPPYTLIMAVEKRTETLVYEMMSKWCDTPGAEGVQDIIRESTLIFMPEIPFTQLACHDYDTITPFQPLIEHAWKELPQIDYVVLFGSGGLKVRYIKANASVADRLAKTYKLFHPQMSTALEDICPKGIANQAQVLGAFEWNKTIPSSKALDALLVQTGCCYEERGSGHLYAENRESIVAMMSERLKGVRLVGDDASLALRVEAGELHPLKMSSNNYGAVFIGLPNGTHHVQVMKDGKLYAQFKVEITSLNPLVEKWIELHHSLWRNNAAVVATLVLLMMMACFFCCRQRVTSVLNRRGFFTGSREGFERIPLYKSDDEDEEDLFDLQKL
ncbi:hypothetical protein V3C99_005393 [Haemonchus contortus]